ncbi:MAG TPA: nitronate monooxygenase [Caldimonas sp.]|nr:nitronate monooxygenase [Caldimonas sp.]
MIRTAFTVSYRLDHPIACAGMAFAGMTPALPIAVSSAGAMGSLANVGFFPPPLLEQLVGSIRAATAKPFSINFITLYAQDAIIETAARLAPASVSFHWGRPEPRWVTQLHQAGVRVWEQVGSVEQARRAVDDGIDLVIVQGSEAGGHNYGSMPTLTLLPAVRDALGDEMPILAAGGIVDGRGLAAVLALGADGAWVGTRFVATEESDAHPQWKQRLVAADGTQTVRTHVFGRHHPAFNPMRVLRNDVVAQWHERVADIPQDNSSERVIGSMDVWGQSQQLHRFQNLAPMAGASGDFEEMPLLAGQGVGGVHEILPAGIVVERMSHDAQAILQRLAGAAA